DDLDNIESAREDYDEAKEELTEARNKVSDDTKEGFMLQRMDWNMDYTRADIDYSYYQLKEDQENMDEAEKKAMDLVDRHRFDGVILQNSYLMQRYDPNDTRENTLWVYDMYKAKDAGRIQKLVKGLEEENEIYNEKTVQTLITHLKAVKQFE